MLGMACALDRRERSASGGRLPVREGRPNPSASEGEGVGWGGLWCGRGAVLVDLKGETAVDPARRPQAPQRSEERSVPPGRSSRSRASEVKVALNSNRSRASEVKVALRSNRSRASEVRVP